MPLIYSVRQFCKNLLYKSSNYVFFQAIWRRIQLESSVSDYKKTLIVKKMIFIVFNGFYD